MARRGVTTYREMARKSPYAVVQIVQEALGQVLYLEALRELSRTRRDSVTGRSFTAAQELTARCDFRGLVTTNYDPGIVNAQMAVRPQAASTGFASWTDEDAMDAWRTSDVFTEDELPVLYTHGHHNQPDAIVLATTEYRRAYRSGLDRVLHNLLETRHVVWIARFRFTDRRIMAILHQIEAPTKGAESTASDPYALAHVAEIEYGC
jgi:hypothetical protein